MDQDYDRTARPELQDTQQPEPTPHKTLADRWADRYQASANLPGHIRRRDNLRAPTRRGSRY